MWCKRKAAAANRVRRASQVVTWGRLGSSLESQSDTRDYRSLSLDVSLCNLSQLSKEINSSGKRKETKQSKQKCFQQTNTQERLFFWRRRKCIMWMCVCVCSTTTGACVMYFSLSFKKGRSARCGHVGKKLNICAKSWSCSCWKKRVSLHGKILRIFQ